MVLDVVGRVVVDEDGGAVVVDGGVDELGVGLGVVVVVVVGGGGAIVVVGGTVVGDGCGGGSGRSCDGGRQCPFPCSHGRS